MFTNDMIERIILHTNEKLEEARVTYASYEKRPDLKPTDSVEIKVLLGILYYTAIFKSNHEDFDSMFASDGTGRIIFRATMSKKRALFLLSCLRFDNKNDRPERVQDDRAAAVSIGSLNTPKRTILFRNTHV